jgi:hypothetical protein
MRLLHTLFLSLGLFISGLSYADSPLTSTSFSLAYNTEPIVMAAGRARGKITKQLMDYLSDGSKPIEIKVAVINKLSWDINGKNNASVFLDYLIHSKTANDSMIFTLSDTPTISTYNPFIETLNADELLCYSYLLSLDNYFNVDVAVDYAEKAVQLKPDSYTFCIITALIQAQHISITETSGSSNTDCEMHKICANVKDDLSLKKDMKDEAIKIIFEYMDIYKCI